jgi:hypothetical protein
MRTRQVTIATFNMGSMARRRWPVPNHASIEFGPAIARHPEIFGAHHTGGIDFGSDFVCVSKHALSYGVSGNDVELAVAVPGPEADRLAATAQRAGCYAIMGFLERNGVKPLNSAVVLDGA